MGYHTPKMTEEVLKRVQEYTENHDWYDSSYGNDLCDSIELEIANDNFIKIMLPNSFIDDEDSEYFVDFVILDNNQDTLLRTKDLNKVIDYINDDLLHEIARNLIDELCDKYGYNQMSLDEFQMQYEFDEDDAKNIDNLLKLF